jgi:hypothetical protein
MRRANTLHPAIAKTLLLSRDAVNYAWHITLRELCEIRHDVLELRGQTPEGGRHWLVRCGAIRCLGMREGCHVRAAPFSLIRASRTPTHGGD